MAKLPFDTMMVDIVIESLPEYSQQGTADNRFFMQLGCDHTTTAMQVTSCEVVRHVQNYSNGGIQY